MESLIVLIAVLVFFEIREKRRDKDFRLLKNKINSVSMQVKSDLEKIQNLNQICEKISTETGAILKEYKINGVPLGYARRDEAAGVSFDVVEGL